MSTSKWPTTAAKRLLSVAYEARLFLQLAKVRSELTDFENDPALGLNISDPSVSLRLNAKDTTDWSRVWTARGHCFSLRVNYCSQLARGKRTKNSNTGSLVGLRHREGNSQLPAQSSS